MTVASLVGISGAAILVVLFWLVQVRDSRNRIGAIEEIMSRSYGKRSLKEWEHRYTEIRSILEWDPEFIRPFALILSMEPLIWLAWIVLTLTLKLRAF